MRRASWSRAVHWVVAHPLVVDVVLAAALTVVSVVQGLDDLTGKWQHYDGTAIALTALTTLPTAARRLAPTTVFYVCSAFSLCHIAAGYNPLITTYGFLLALYTMAATESWRRTMIALVIGCSIWIYAGILSGSTSVFSAVLQSLVIPGVIWKVADSAKQLAVRNGQLAQANEQLLRDREERARRAVVDERVRIARELHDVVAHHMSVVTVQAGLAEYVLRSDPDTAQAAMRTVLDVSGEALDEMRRALALLRVGAETEGTEPETYDPAPGLSSLPELFNRVRAAGVPVDVRVTGTPQPLSPGLELCVYRVVQECLTNVLRHAAPATASVELHYGPREVVAVVRDDGEPPPTRPPDARTGQGLIGMRERAMLYGGGIEAGPRADRGFEVRLVLPVSTTVPRDDRDGDR